MIYLMNDEEMLDLNISKEQNIKIEREFMVNHLRLWANQFDIREQDLLIPDGCEDKGFVEGKHKISNILQFLADMLEE